MVSLFRKMSWWMRRRRKEEELRDELQFHLEEEADERRAEGVPDDQAMQAARRDLGNVTLVREETRTLWTWILLEQVGQDIRYALRAVRRSPGFAAAAILTLGIGIGVNTAIFSVVNAVILRPLPYRDPANLVLVDTSPLILAPAWLTTAWRERARTLSDFAGFNGPRAGTLVDNGTSQQIDAAGVTWNFLSLLGVAPVIGRDFVAADANRGGQAVAILSHEFWQRVYGSDPAIVGKMVTVSGTQVTVVGVAPAQFRFPTGGALPATGVPPDTQPDFLRVTNVSAPVNVIGRLAPGSTPAAATSELLAIFKQEGGTEFRREAIDRFELHAAPLQDRLVGNVRQRLWLVTGAVGFVLLIACANVANLLLARASTRQRELTLRMALGASRRRVARLVVTESVVLALFGSAAALVLAYTSSGAARALLANRVPHVGAITIDTVVLTFNFVLALVSGVLCGLVSLPGIRRASIASISDSGAYAVTARSRLRRLLLSAETAFTFILFVAAALFVQTLWNLSARDRGFDADRVLTVRVAPGLPTGLSDRDHRAGSKFFANFFDDLRHRMDRVPGVVSAAAVSLGPLEGFSGGFSGVAVDGRTASTESFTPVAFVTPDYFRTMRIPIVRGRDFTDDDRLGESASLVAIVNEAFQRRYAPNSDILGAHVTSVGGPEVFTVVGITRDVPDRSLRESPEPLLIAPLAQMPGVHISWGALTFVLRTADSDPLRLAPEVRRTIWAINPNIVITDIASMNARVAVGMRSERDSALLFGLFAITALVMAAIGVYGVAAYAIAQRTKEIGIRVALGAARHDVSRLIMSQTLWPTLIGMAIGVAAAAMLTRFVASMIYGVTPLDPVAFAVGAVGLVSVAIAATWMPARRAMRIDPLVALRCD
jgi:putative ABC transport system permease protein